MPIVFSHLDESVSICTLEPEFLARQTQRGESTEAAVRRLAAVIQRKVPRYEQSTFQVLARADIPIDRSQRYAWRVRQGHIEIDALIPKPAHPRQMLLDQIDQANTLPELKALMRKLVADGF